MNRAPVLSRLAPTLLMLAAIVATVGLMFEAGTIRAVDLAAERAPGDASAGATPTRPASAATRAPREAAADSTARPDSSPSESDPVPTARPDSPPAPPGDEQGTPPKDLRLEIPLEPRADIRIIGRFGDPRDGGARTHQGLDLGAARGTEVRAGLDGIVRIGTSPLGGNVVWVESDLATLFYGHLERHSVATGQRVVRGDLLGTVGASGNAQTPHLHFEVHDADGTPIDPLPLLADALSP